MIIKLFICGGVTGKTQIIHIWPCLKPYYCQTTLVNNPDVSGMLVTLPNIVKITLSVLWLSKVKGHGPQIWLFLAPAINFLKFSYLATALFLDLEEFLLIKLALTYENFIAKYQMFVRYFGSNLARNEKTRKVGYLCRLGSQIIGKPVDLLLLWLLCFFSFSPVWVRQWRHKAIANTSKYARWKNFSYNTFLVDVTLAVCKLSQKSCSNVNTSVSAVPKGFLARVKIPIISVEPPLREMFFSVAKFLAHTSNKLKQVKIFVQCSLLE